MKTVPDADPCRVDGREQDVRVRVAEVVVDAPAGADDVLAVAADVPRHADARLDVVVVFLRRLAPVLEAGDAVEEPGLARRACSFAKFGLLDWSIAKPVIRS